MHPVLQGQDPATYKRRPIIVTPATKQGKRAVGQLLAQQQQQQQQLAKQRALNGAESSTRLAGNNSDSDSDSVSDMLHNNSHPNVAFMLMLAQLQRWKKRHGSCHVPAGVFDKPQLAQWVGHMRQLRAEAAAAAAAASDVAAASSDGGGGSSSEADASRGSSGGGSSSCSADTTELQTAQQQQQHCSQPLCLQPWQVLELEAVGIVWQASQVRAAGLLPLGGQAVCH
jgi:hypothetical protein